MQREDAERVIRNLIGVCGISNKLEVAAPQVDEAGLKRTIAEALERHAAREAKRIDFDVRNGRVNVSGTVHSWDTKQAVLGAARGTPGVRTVEDNVHVSPRDA
jgi:osmotically-inducible protein OsmY